VTRVILALSERQPWMAELEAQLRPEAYQVRVAAPGTQDWSSSDADLILLDVANPEEDALAAYRLLRGIGATPLLLLTAAYTDRIVVEALEAGADGCLPAHISPRELAAWVLALLRRRSQPPTVRSTRFRLGSLTIDLTRGRVVKGDAPLSLPPTQMLLLRALAERPGEVVPREHLLTQVLGPLPRRKMSTLHVHMFTLRTIIEEDPQHPRHLKTIRGVGYVLDAVTHGEGDSL
jgi:DNA-binding response OmpR family regulator